MFNAYFKSFQYFKGDINCLEYIECNFYLFYLGLGLYKLIFINLIHIFIPAFCSRELFNNEWYIIEKRFDSFCNNFDRTEVIVKNFFPLVHYFWSTTLLLLHLLQSIFVVSYILWEKLLNGSSLLFTQHKKWMNWRESFRSFPLNVVHLVIVNYSFGEGENAKVKSLKVSSLMYKANILHVLWNNILNVRILLDN